MVSVCRDSKYSIWNPYLEYLFGISIWNPYLEYLFRISIWNIYLEYLFGILIWNTYLEYLFGILVIWNTLILYWVSLVSLTWLYTVDFPDVLRTINHFSFYPRTFNSLIERLLVHL